MFLANENFPKPSIDLLRQAEIAVQSIQEEFAGIADEQVLQIARDRSLVILTFDRDYGELIFRYQASQPPAVVYFREKGQDPLFAGQVLLSLIKNDLLNFFNCFTVVEKNSVRQRFYPEQK